ncbi:MAG: metallophosphoesterase [Bdellovibrionaceae bacterium]|nr:metallophosphoesterase [Pseudobdellovibrionaceae bacterium]MBX3032810.1 metallophosphoesterase [Pseudobdellovibrionaceae bacterium]
MLIYSLIVCLSLSLAWFYVWERLIETATLAEPLRQAVLGFFVIAYGLQAARWLLFRIKGDLSWLIGPAYFSFGLLSHLFLATLFKDFLYQIWWWWFPQNFEVHQAWVNSWVSYGVFFSCLGASLWGAQNAYEGPEVRRVVLDATEGRAPTRVLKLVQISDLHVGPIIKKSYVENIVRLVNAEKPDVIAVTGDIADGKPEFLEEDMDPLERLEAPLGIYYVTGNHEYYWNVDLWLHAVKCLGMKVLFNSGELLPGPGRPIWIAGVPDISARAIRPDHHHDPVLALMGAPVGSFNILLAHQPKSVLTAEPAGAHLVLSGHTHGGQYFPFTLVVGWFNVYVKGLYRHGRAWIYVNLGTGFWGPPLRLGATSEITSFEIRL